MGLGSATGAGKVGALTLAMAREKAEGARRILATGGDPITEKRRQKTLTFGETADDLIDSMKAGWRNEKHQAQWEMTLATYAAPIRKKSVSAITTEDVLGILKPIWLAKPETASRLRGRIEKVLDYARAKGLREGENPARWRGNLDHLLPRAAKLTRGHHAAMAYSEVPRFITHLQDIPGAGARALELAILTACRSGEVLGAEWSEIDLDKQTWTIPAGRMKAGREHAVALSQRAVDLLGRLKETADGSFVFPGAKGDKPLSNMAMTMVLRRLKIEVTVHGFRSSFRDWVGNETSFPRELAEEALAHTVGDAVERAYRRGSAIERRRQLMNAWAEYVENGDKGVSTKVVRLPAAVRP